MKKSPFWLCLAAVAALTSVAIGAFLESDFPNGKKPPEVLPPRPIPPRPPTHENEVTQLISECTVGRPYYHQGLTVFPITLRRNLDNRLYWTMDEAHQNGNLGIEDSGRVPEVIIHNRSRRRVFLMAGEVVTGGKQNRMIRQDVVIPTGERVRVPVYCVEKGRWEGEATDMKARGTMTPPGLRLRAAQDAKQEDVWKEISESARKLSVQSKTENLQSFYEEGKIRRQLDEYQRAFRPIWRLQPIGIVVCRFGRIVGAEIFGGSYLFSRLQHKVLDSYILDRLHYPMLERHPRPDTGDVERFLNRVHRARMVYGSTPGEGRSVSISGSARGSALSLGGIVTHLTLFEEQVVIYREER